MARSRKKGFVANKAGIGRILREDPGIGAALDAIAEPAAAEAGGTVDAYVTDRQVRSVLVDPEDQAIEGVGTRAMGRRGMTQR